MELSNSKIKKFIIFLKKAFPTFQLKPHPSPHLKKKFRPEKNSLYFEKWNFLTLRLKRFRKRKPRKKTFLIFQETEALKKHLIFQETEPFSTPRKNFLYFRNVNLERKRNFLIFREWYIQNLSIFKTRDIFRIVSNICDRKFCKKIAT